MVRFWEAGWADNFSASLADHKDIKTDVAVYKILSNKTKKNFKLKTFGLKQKQTVDIKLDNVFCLMSYFHTFLQIKHKFGRKDIQDIFSYFTTKTK